MDNIELAESLFAAFANGDEQAVRRLCSEDLQAIQNFAAPMSLDSLLQFSLAVNRLVADFHYEDAIRTETSSGFVEEHRVCGTLPDGSELNLAACVIAEVEQGRVTVLREYLDGVAARGLVKALSNAGSRG